MSLRGPIGRAVRAGLAATAVLLVLGVPSAHAAEEQPAILRAYGLDWIARVQEEAWPQAPDRRPVICLLDTGVNITPDTPADNPYGPIVARLALDGGSGTAQGSTAQHLHGTQMATVIGAPRNGVGTIGVYPQARIVSIRVTAGNEVYMTPGAVQAGAAKCASWAIRDGARVAAVAVAESNYSARAGDLEYWQQAAASAGRAQATFIAAAGNDASSRVVPLGVPGVVAVTAGDSTGAACEFVADVPQPGGLRAPGCGSGWSAGSSAATAAVAALAGALVAREPSLTPAQLRELLVASSVPSGDQRVLRGAGLQARFAGLVAAAPPLSTVTPLSDGLQVSVDRGESLPGRLWRPTLRARWTGARVVVTRQDHRGGRVLALQRTASGSVWRGVGRRLRVPFQRRPRTVRVWVESGRSATWRSLAVTLRVQ